MKEIMLWFLAALVTAGPVASVSADGGATAGAAAAAKVLEPIVRKVLHSATSRHPKVPTYSVDGRTVVLYPLTREDGARAGVDFDLPGDGTKVFRAYLVLAGSEWNRMALQMKYNARWDTDPNESTVFRLGEPVRLATGNRKYFAMRGGMESEHILARYPSATIVLIENGLSLDRVRRAFGL